MPLAAAAPRPRVTAADGNKAVLLNGVRIGFAESWTEALIVLGLEGHRLRPGVTVAGSEGPSAFHIDERAVEPITE